ncbi:MAG: hypothetical protein Q7T20_06225, partial [Saprospiraceae bacterium]|nr:hypothetical protein [Saprospiraceae bacterium]
MSTNPYNDDKRLLELLERWHSGDFSRANEQELKALADSDEFRRETVEGFWSMPETDYTMHLASLRKRLRRRTSGSVFRVSYRRILVAAAAVTLLILSVVWFLPTTEKSAPIAQQEAIEPVENQSIASNIPEEKAADDEMFRSSAPKLDRLDKPAQSKPATPMMESGPAASGSAAEVASAPPPVLSSEEELADKIMAAEPKASEGEY